MRLDNLKNLTVAVLGAALLAPVAAAGESEAGSAASAPSQAEVSALRDEVMALRDELAAMHRPLPSVSAGDALPEANPSLADEDWNIGGDKKLGTSRRTTSSGPQ